MVYQFKLEKIMKLKEREKDEALSVYNDSVKNLKRQLKNCMRLLRKKRI